MNCPTCGQPVQAPVAQPMSDAELDALSAWWLTGSARKAARLLGLSEQTVKNQLGNARSREGVHKTTLLIQRHIAELRSHAELVRSHKQRVGRAA